MASKQVHIETANRFHGTLDYLCNDVECHAPWIVTIAFYKALHVVEAAFAIDNNVRHTHCHKERRNALTSHMRYSTVFKHYSRLESLSRCARYLAIDSGSSVAKLEDYLPVAKIGEEVLFHRLRQVEKSCAKLAGGDLQLESVESLRTKFG